MHTIDKQSLTQRGRLVGLVAMLILTGACAATSSPAITELKVVTGATEVTVGQEVALAANISNPVGEAVTYNWSVQAGGQDRSADIVTVSPDVAAATYRPQVAGNHIITLQMLNRQKAVIAATNITIVANPVIAHVTQTPEAVQPTRLSPTDTPSPSATPSVEPVSIAEATQAISTDACPGGQVSDAPQPMPFWVYGAAGKHFCPAGYMGDTGDVTLTQGDVIAVQYRFQGNKATCDYSPCKWAGVYWLNPAYTTHEHWAAQANSGYNLSRARVVRFRVRSEKGARVEFFAGGNTDPHLSHPSSLPKQSTGLVTLTPDWQELQISLAGASQAELAYVIDGFGWSASWNNNAGVSEITFEIADIRYE
jgi:hypothetical protein